MYYVIRVQTQADDVWVTLKRYSQFEEFHYMLLDCVAEHSLPAGVDLPGTSILHYSSLYLPSPACHILLLRSPLGFI